MIREYVLKHGAKDVGTSGYKEVGDDIISKLIGTSKK